MSFASESRPAFVRVHGISRGVFVQFSFALGDDDLSIDLVLPRDAFFEFCREHATTIACDPSARAAFDALKGTDIS